MKQSWLTGAMVAGVCLGTLALFGALPVRGAPTQAPTRPAVHLLLNAAFLSQPVFSQILPRLEAFASATEMGNAAGFQAITAPGFRLIRRSSGGEAGAKARKDMADLLTFSMGDGSRHDTLTSLTLSARKSFPKPGRVGVVLEDEASWKVPPGKGRRFPFPTGRNISLCWTLTWARVDARATFGACERFLLPISD